MKDSDVEWIGEIPLDWGASKLKNVVRITLGQSPEEEINLDANGLPFYQGNADFGVKYPTPTSWCISPKKIAEGNDILVSVRAPVGELNICKEKSGIGRGVAALTTPNYEFFYYTLKAAFQEMEKLSTGSTFDAIGHRELSQIKLPNPLSHEKKILVDYLDSETSKIYNAINNIESEIAKLEEYRKSLIYEVVTGKVKVKAS